MATKTSNQKRDALANKIADHLAMWLTVNPNAQEIHFDSLVGDSDDVTLRDLVKVYLILAD